MIDSDNVFLLRPVDEGSRLDLDTSRRRAPGVASVTICPLGPGRAPAFARHFAGAIEPALRAAGANVRARLVTEHAANTYPALPVRDGEEVFVWLSLFADERSRDEHVERSGLERHVAGQLADDIDVLRLEPTGRSLLPDY